jgi:hypothetical protein
MNVKEEEYSDVSIYEWLKIKLKIYHYEKYGVECEIIENELNDDENNS